MGSPKALLAYRGETFLGRLQRLFLAATDPVVVVLGHDAATVREVLDGRVIVALNDDPERGMLSSLQVGLLLIYYCGAEAPRKLKLAPQRLLFLPLDYPAIQQDTITKLCATPLADVAMPRYQGRRGHPVLISQKVARELLNLPPTAAARDVIRQYNDTILYVDVDDPAILMDVDTPEDYQALLSRP